MELFRQAANTDGDYVIFRRCHGSAQVHYQVYVYNNRTAHSLLAYTKTIDMGAAGQRFLEQVAQIEGMTAFEEACDFMGIKFEEVDE